jgi:alkylation response protein AidB-like acyl-CoA dehydrogenase
VSGITVAAVSDATSVRPGRRVVAAFDGYLGDPRDAASVIATDRSLELDESAEFPSKAIEAVDAWGLHRYYAPRRHGGELSDVLVPMMLIRRLASRDVTVASAHGKTFLGAVGAWIADGPIATTMADLVLSGGPVSWGLTERGRGSDLSSTATTATLGTDIEVSGVKWPANNATRGRAMTVLARTSEQPGPRSLSLVLVDKQRVDGRTLTPEPKIVPHGLRGADISGLAMRRTVVTADMLVGAPGSGLELVLKSLQLTRPLSTALSLGAADHALAIAVDFAATRRLFGRGLAELPAAHAALGTAVADALLAEAVMYAGAREAHHATGEMALVSALVKFLVPETVDLLIHDLTAFLGVRSQLLGVAGAGAFQKAARDNRAVGIFDGNSVVNLNMIVNEFTAIARDAEAPDAGPIVESFRFDTEPDAWVDPALLRLVTRRGSRLLRALPSLVDLLGSRASATPARQIEVELRRLVDFARQAPRESAPSAFSFDVAERIALCFGASCAIAVELAGPDRESAASEARLLAILERLAVRLGLRAAVTSAGSAAALADLALEAAADGRHLSLIDGWEDAA